MKPIVNEEVSLCDKKSELGKKKRSETRTSNYVYWIVCVYMYVYI